MVLPMSMRFAVALALLVACGDDGGMATDAGTSDTGVAIDAVPSGPVDFATFIGGSDRKWCLVTDRAALSLTANPESAISQGDEWCPKDKNCDAICAAWINPNPPAAPVAEWFAACDPVRKVLLGANCVR